MWLIGSSVAQGYLRAASPYERRCIEREDLGFYGALLVGGVYQFRGPVDVDSALTYTQALQRCIARHPQLASTVIGTGTKTPEYQFCPQLDLHDHIQIIEQSDANDHNEAVERALPGMLNATWKPCAPRWKIHILPLSVKECFLAFSYSHALGDGMSGLTFHKTFLDALQDQSDQSEDGVILSPTFKPIHPPFDTPKNLPISWSFLLTPLLGTFLPNWLMSLLGLRLSISPIPTDTWTGSPMFYQPEKHQNQVALISIESTTVRETLQICRRNGAKLTALLHQIIVSALSQSLQPIKDVDQLAVRTALSTRAAVGASVDDMGNFVSGDLDIYPTKDAAEANVTKIDWSLARSVTEKLAHSANDLRDHPVGLLRYVKDIRGWILSQVGKPRDASCEVSNIVSFKPLNPTPRCSVTKMVFCQPADSLGSALNFNAVSVDNGPMCITVTWQLGALGLGTENSETEFVQTLCQRIQNGFARLAANSGDRDT